MVLSLQCITDNYCGYFLQKSLLFLPLTRLSVRDKSGQFTDIQMGATQVSAKFP